MIELEEQEDGTIDLIETKDDQTWRYTNITFLDTGGEGPTEGIGQQIQTVYYKESK